MKVDYKKILAGGILIVAVISVFVYLKTTYLSKQEIKELVASDIKANIDDIHFDSIDLEMDKNLYEVEFYYKNQEYEYKVNAKTGKIINKNIDKDEEDDDEDVFDSTPGNNSNNDKELITEEEAKKIVFERENITEKDALFLRVVKDYDDGITCYEVDFIYNNYEYEYKINAKTGSVISFDKEAFKE